MDLNDEISIDGDVVTICGIKYSLEIFRQFGGMLPIGQTFKLYSRDGDVVAIQRVEP